MRDGGGGGGLSGGRGQIREPMVENVPCRMINSHDLEIIIEI